MSDSFLELDSLTKSFDGAVAVGNVSLRVPRGTVLALLGPSGSGKTTMLRLLAGFEQPDSGRVLVDGSDVTALPPVERRFGMVFQHYALFPHLNVEENVAFGLTDVSREKRAERVAEVLSLVDMDGYADREVTALSGGQQQRVAVARALAPKPRVLLLDEPLSNLDPGLRERTRRELRSALVQAGVTTVFVTHEQEEAFALGDRIAVLNDGLLEQVGSARSLYEEPESVFVATFVGRASTLSGIKTAGGEVRIAESVSWNAEVPEDLGEGAPVTVVVRPEAVSFTDGPGLEGSVTECRYTGARAFFTVSAGNLSVELEAPVDSASVGDTVRITASRVRCFREES